MTNKTGNAPPFGIAIHGGAGATPRATTQPGREAAYRATLTQALNAGHHILQAGGSSLDAVCAAIVVLEDSPLFNAGKGAVFNAAGEIELDAAIMDGSNRKAGAIAAVRSPKNPILLARAVMEHTDHVLLAGEGAEMFARAQGFAEMPPEYFFTQERWDELQAERKRALTAAPNTHGTVGAVALDRSGNLAAGTSTGGRTNKMAGRVGDTPVIGAGTYADNATCAVSATGHGEFFVRMVVAHDIAARMRYAQSPLVAAADDIVLHGLEAGSGGLIAIDRQGNVAMPFNTERMFRGYMGNDGGSEGRRFVGIFRE
jgi:L-asparaginase / beta-aspartyl-peptidase